MRLLLFSYVAAAIASCASQCVAQDLGQWVWHADGTPDQVFMRHAFEINEPVKSVSVKATCDNGFTLFVNDKKSLSGTAWERVETVDVSKQLVVGKNTFAVQAINQGGPAGFMLVCDIVTKSGKKRRITTGKSWRSTTKANGKWKASEFDDSSWKPVKELGKVGDGSLPWTGNVNARTIRGAFADQPEGLTYKPMVPTNAKAIDGFKLEKIYRVPRSMGSWVSVASRPDGSLYACDQGRAGLYRIWPGNETQSTRVEKVGVSLTGAQGLLWAFDSLYAVVNGGPSKSGLHRLMDSDGDGKLDESKFLMDMPGGGEHGPHAVILSPDKKSLYVCAGNHTSLPPEIVDSRIPRNWSEDLLLPRRWDANGHAAGRLAPGGWICEVDPEGKNRTIHSIGFRNEYDIAFNADGELFSYDADMEWDLGSPWYRPTRVVHATSGSEFGWRSGTGKWPTYYEDSLPPAVDIGPGSPVGITFGYGAKFPAKYQQALFILDWTYSTIYAVHLTPNGASYVGKSEDFVTGQPLQVTDVTIGTDGAMYFAVGGRGTQSEMYRVTYVGDESTAVVDAKNSQASELRSLRKKMESFHGEGQADDATALDEIFANLGHSDRFIRYSARIALEARKVDLWRDRAGMASEPTAVISAAIALSRQGSSDDLNLVLKRLEGLELKSLSVPQQLAYLRAMQVAFARLGAPADAKKRELRNQLETHYPSENPNLNAELVQLLVYLESDQVVRKTIALMDRLSKEQEPVPDWGYLVQRHKGYGGTVGRLLDNMPPLRSIHFAFVLRNQKIGWTLQDRKKYLQFLVDASKFPGGNSYTKFISQFRDDALTTFTPAERIAVGELASASLLKTPPKVDPPKGPGRKWSRDAALPLVTGLKKRNFNRGRELFHATQCAKCHRLGGEGGAIGPDLSTAGRKFPLPDLLDALIEPSKVISDQYGSEKILTTDGETLIGRVVRLEGKLHVYSTDANAPPKILDEDDVEHAAPSKVSQMPAGLVDTLNPEELKDLIAYLLSGGNQRDKIYR